MDNLRTTWDLLNGELTNEIQKLGNATNAKDLIVMQAWYNAACAEWDIVINHTKDLNNRTISSTHVSIG